jgi:hypothetical protein
MDAHPDESVSRSFYGPQFGQSAARLGGGFKNFRPLKLVGAVRQADGTYLGGRVVLAANREIPDYSLEQYRGNLQAKGDGPDARFEYNKASLGLFEYARASMSGGDFAFNPGYELQVTMQSLCHEIKERALHVNSASAIGLPAKAQPAVIFNSKNDAEWAANNTLAADTRMRNSFVQLYLGVARMLKLADQRDARTVQDHGTMRERLEEAYDAASRGCTITYTNSNNKPVTLELHDIGQRLFALDFDPYHCIERRWGAASADELASCKDGEAKARWYKAEQVFRNQVDSGFILRQAVSLPDVEKLAQSAAASDIPGMSQGGDMKVDVRLLLAPPARTAAPAP